VLNSVHGGFAGHGRKVIQKLIQRLAVFQIIEQGLKWNAGPAENGVPPRMSGSRVITLFFGTMMGLC